MDSRIYGGSLRRAFLIRISNVLQFFAGANWKSLLVNDKGLPPKIPSVLVMVVPKLCFGMLVMKSIRSCLLMALTYCSISIFDALFVMKFSRTWFQYWGFDTSWTLASNCSFVGGLTGIALSKVSFVGLISNFCTFGWPVLTLL